MLNADPNTQTVAYDFDASGITDANAREMAEIKKAAVAGSTFMKAPNGQPTNLTERQWLQVRTQAFKEWFGEWENAIQYDYLLSEKWVSELTGNEFQKDGTPLTKKVTQFYLEKYNGEIERVGLGIVELSKEGVKDSLAHGIGKAKSAAYAAVPEIIRDGVIIDRRKNWKGRGKDTYVIAAPVKIGDKGYTGFVVITQSTVKNKFYLHEVTLQKNLRHGFQTFTEEGSPLGDIAKIIQNFETAKENSSKVVDENGEPLVFYTGTRNGGFTVPVVYHPMFLTSNFKTAEGYAREYRKPLFFEKFPKDNTRRHSQVYGFFINAKNIDVLDAEGKSYSEFSTELPDDFDGLFAGKRSMDDIKRYVAYSKKPTLVKNIYDNKDYNTDEISDVLVVMPNGTQIKSATSNNGNFDEESDDIRFQFIGEKGAANLDKAEEATTRMDNLNVAREMETADKETETPRQPFPTKIGGIELTTGQRAALANGKTIKMIGLSDKSGNKCTSDIRWNPQERKIEYINCQITTLNIALKEKPQQARDSCRKKM